MRNGITDNDCLCIICARYDPSLIDHYDQDHADIIRRHGWAVVVIPDMEPAMWAFTIGLWHSYRQPELAIFGLEPRDMHRVLNQAGASIAAGRPVPVIEGIRPVHHDWRPAFFGAAGGVYRDSGPALNFLQMLWPDTDGNFPGQHGCASECEDGQPWLWLRPAEHPLNPWLGHRV